MIRVESRSRGLRTVFIAVSLLAGAACSKDELPTVANRPVSRSVVAERPRSIRREEQAFDSIARRLPGFGGFYWMPDGSLVLVTNDSAERAPLAAVGAALRTRPDRTSGRSAVGRVTVALGRFSFYELARGRDALLEHGLGAIRGLHGLDLDEKANRVHIEVLPEFVQSATAAAKRVLAEIGLDTLALEVSTREQPHLATRATPYVRPMPLASTLDGWSDEIVGGLMWSHPLPGGQAQCTVGAVAVRSGVTGFVSGSHCTDFWFGDDGTQAYQPTVGTRHIATETRDPNGSMCWYSGNEGWWGWYACRFSDAAFFATTGVVPMQKGLIARTTYSAGPGGTTDGSKTIDNSNPYFIVSAIEPDIATGWYVQKMGWVSGWTTGYINQTCSDHLMTNEKTGETVLMKCSMSSYMNTKEGDSGGPLFTLDPIAGDVRLLGTLWGGHSDGEAFFSPFWRAMDELGGTWDATRGFALTAPSPTGSVSGYGNPILSWPAVSGATRYVVFREWSRYATGQSGNDEFVQPSGIADTDFQVTSYTGSTMPGPHTPGYVAYYVVAYNQTDRSLESSIRYFQLAP